MAKNVIFHNGDKLSIPVLSGVVSGSPVVLGSYLPGIALTDRNSAGLATCKFSGVVLVSVVAAGAQAIGAPIFITTATGVLTDAAGAGKVFYGVLLTTIAGAATVSVRVRIGGTWGVA